MANLGNLIVRGVTRILGDAYANKFIGNLQGNADTATSAIKASTADSATSAISANKALIATAVQDYGTSDHREIKIGYNGSGLSSSTITHAVGFTDGGTKIKDISKDEFRNWLATASGTWGISITGNAGYASSAGYADSAGNADTSNRAKFLETFHQNSTTNTWGSQYPIWAQWSDATNVRLKCTNYTVWTDKANYANSAGNADTVDNMHASTLLHLDGYYYIPGNNNNSSTKFWSKIGSITFTAAWQECGASLTFYEWEARYMMGELKFNIRTSSSKSNAGADIVWMNLTNKKFENSFIICRTGNGTYDIYFEYPAISYINIKFYIISQYDNGYITWQNGSALTSTEPTYINEKFISSLSSWVGNANYATSAGSVAWSNVTEKPTTISGYGITDAYTKTQTDNKLSGYLPLSGGTLTGSVTMSGMDTNLIRNIVCDYTSGWSRDLIALQVDGVSKFTVSAYGNYTAGASDNGIYYGYIGCNSYYGLNLRISATSLSWGDNSILHSGNYNSYSPTLTGTGATGTWGINISGNAATATDANTLDGYHADSFAKNLYLGTTDLNSIDNSSLGQQNSSDRATPELHYPVQEAGGLISILSVYSSTNQIYGTYNSNRWFARGAGMGLSSRTSWREFAFLDSNIASASKWENARTITLTGSVTGSVSIDGSGDVSLATTTNHTHTFASLTEKPTTISEYGITDAYTKTQIDTKLSRYLTEQNLQGYATQSWVRGEEYLYRSGGTMDARAIIGITTKLFIGNSTSPDTCYTKFNCILHGGGDESNPNWIIRDNGYSEFKSSVSANAFYASSDIRLKNILDDINIDFDKLKLIPKKYYTWKGSDILQLGTIAQDIQKIYPEVVSKNENGYLSVDYSKLSIIALAAIDKLNERIKELECQIKL